MFAAVLTPDGPEDEMLLGLVGAARYSSNRGSGDNVRSNVYLSSYRGGRAGNVRQISNSNRDPGGVERVGLRSAVLSTIPIFLVQLLPRRSFESKVLCIFRIRSVLSDWLHVRKSALISELGVKRFFHIGKVLD
jgi:hypothetical protein